MATAEAAAKPPSEAAASGLSRGLSKIARAREGRIDRRVSSALPTSRAPRLAEEIVVVLDALAPSCLQLHLAITSRIDLLLWKGHESAH